MKCLTMVLLAGLMLVTLTGCTTSTYTHMAGAVPAINSGAFPCAPLVPPPGMLFTEYQAPLSIDYDRTPVNPGKVGTSMYQYISVPFYPMLSFAWDDPASIETAARNGGLDLIEYADYEVLSVLGVYTQFQIKAYGR